MSGTESSSRVGEVACRTHFRSCKVGKMRRVERWDDTELVHLVHRRKLTLLDKDVPEPKALVWLQLRAK